VGGVEVHAACLPAPEPSARPGSGAKYGDPAEEWSNGFLAGERYARQAAREPSARLDVERMARAIAAWGYEPTVVYRADMKEPTDAQCRMARKIANQYAALAATPQDPRGMSRGFRGTNQRAGLEYSWASRPVPASEPSARLLAAARAVVAAVVDDESGMQTFDFALIDDLGDALDDLEA
jgi:hypothetical protein